MSAFARFLEVASFSQGSMVNFTEVAREVSINRQVIQNYFSILNDLLLSHHLPAFTKRAKRRLITSDKFYYFDAGIYHHLRPKGILDTPSEIAGAALETLFYQSILAIVDYLKTGHKIHLLLARTSNGIEVDFLAYGETSFFDISRLSIAKNFSQQMLQGF